MNPEFIGGVLLGILAALMLNIGKGVQKQKVQVLTKGRRMFSKQHRRDLGIWALGLLLTGGAALPYSAGLKYSQSPSTIAAMTGIGLVGLVLYATKVIKEPFGRTDVIGIAIVVVSTSVLAYCGSGQTPASRDFLDSSLAWAAAVPILVSAAGCVMALFWRRIHGIMFGLAAGVCIGIALFIADTALVRSEGSLGGQLSTPYPYIAMGFGVLALTTTQLGFLRGRALEVVPAVNSATVLTPLILEGVVYGTLPPPASMGLVALILAGVVLLSTGAAARATS